MERIILHCDLNCFYASVELLSHPELRDVPTAVCGDPNSRHGIILARKRQKLVDRAGGKRRLIVGIDHVIGEKQQARPFRRSIAAVQASTTVLSHAAKQLGRVPLLTRRQKIGTTKAAVGGTVACGAAHG